MQVRWTTAAARDLENIADYLFEKNTAKRCPPDTRDLRSGFRSENLKLSPPKGKRV